MIHDSLVLRLVLVTLAFGELQKARGGQFPNFCLWGGDQRKLCICGLAYLRLLDIALLQDLYDHVIVHVGAELVLQISLGCPHIRALGTLSVGLG